MQYSHPEHVQERLLELDLPQDALEAALGQAVTDIRSCTDFDAPAMPGMQFWSRVNRYLAEILTPLGWKWTAQDSILRVIHPTASHAVTAISGAGAVSNLKKSVRSKNPKGPAMARLVEANAELALFSADEIRFGRDLVDIPTWCLLYKRAKNGVVLAELSLPVKMNGKFVDEWAERIPLFLPDLGDPGADISILDLPDGDGPQPHVMVEQR